MADKLTLEGTPAYLLQLGERIQSIEQLLLTKQPEQNHEPYEKPLTVEQAAEFLNMEVPTLRAKVQAKVIPVHKRGRLFFFKSELTEWIRTGEIPQTARLHKEAEQALLNANKRKRARSF